MYSRMSVLLKQLKEELEEINDIVDSPAPIKLRTRSGIVIFIRFALSKVK
ncbi:Uncharacterised protein [Legionella lansingensis]|nr:hypothetical protein [Legionella lansingensis]SNV50264.1 Uncharacterised protein [Legionella lansingensis]